MSSRPLLVVAAASACACSFFEPRVPEDPGGGPPSFYQPPVIPDIVLSNMGGALENSAFSIYMGCLVQEFEFVADPSDVIEYGPGGSAGTDFDFSEWDYDSESSVIGNLLAAAQGSGAPEDSLVRVVFTTISGYPDPPAPVDSAVIWRAYSIEVAGSGWSEWGNPAQGKAKITLLEDASSMWSISRWEAFRPDEYTEGTVTWGVVKASYR